VLGHCTQSAQRQLQHQQLDIRHQQTYMRSSQLHVRTSPSWGLAGEECHTPHAAPIASASRQSQSISHSARFSAPQHSLCFPSGSGYFATSQCLFSPCGSPALRCYSLPSITQGLAPLGFASPIQGLCFLNQQIDQRQPVAALPPRWPCASSTDEAARLQLLHVLRGRCPVCSYAGGALHEPRQAPSSHRRTCRPGCSRRRRSWRVCSSQVDPCPR
jgi:hypothetical protein